MAASSGTVVDENATGETIQSSQVRNDSSTLITSLHPQGLLAYIAGQVLPYQSSEQEVEEVAEEELDDDPIQPRFSKT